MKKSKIGMKVTGVKNREEQKKLLNAKRGCLIPPPRKYKTPKDDDKKKCRGPWTGEEY